VAPKDEVAADLFAVYDVATGQPTGQPAPLAIGDGALRASSDYPGTRTPFAVSLAAGFAAHTSPRGFCVIDLATGQRRWSHEADSFGGRAAALALSVDSQVLAVANPTGAITLWEAGTGRQIGQFPEKSSPVRTLAFTPDGTTLASGHIDRLIRIWDAKRCVLTGTLNGHAYPITNLAVGTDGRTLVSGGRGDEEVLLWDLRRAVHAPVRFSIPAPRWLGWAFSTDGRSVLTSYVENNRWIFNRWSGRDFREREMLAEVPLASRSAIQNQYATWSESPFAIGYTRMVGHPGSFTNLLLGTFFNKLLKTEVGDVINNVVRDRKTKRTITVMDPGFREWGAVSFDGTRLVVYSSGTEPLRIYDTGSSRELISLGSELYLDGSTKAAFSPDGNCVGMQIGSVVHIWTAPSWAEIEAAEKSAR
jgi:WD40 repeat protein